MPVVNPIYERRLTRVVLGEKRVPTASMLRCIRLAAPLFRTSARRGERRAHAIVLDETAATLKRLRRRGLNLVVLSEGVEAFGQRLDQAESLKHPGPFLSCYAEFAAAEKCCVAGPVKLRERGRVYNAVAILGPDGRLLGAYRKNFLTRAELEQGLTPGDGPVMIETPIGRLGGAICFDLNFTSLLEQYARLRPDILVFPSMYHGGLMQACWAYRCQAHFVSALPFLGGGILDPLGRSVAQTDCYSPVAEAVVNLDRLLVHLDFNQEKFPAIRRRYGDNVQIVIPANLGCAMLASTVPGRTAADIVREFGLERLHDYFADSAAANRRARRARR